MPEHVSTLFVAILKRYGIEPPAAVCETSSRWRAELTQKEFRFDELTHDGREREHGIQRDGFL